MKSEVDFYSEYTSTSMLVGQDQEKLTEWSIGYFNANILPHLPADKNARIIDAGCGYGRHIKALKENGYTNVIGLDISEEQIAYAQSEFGLDNVFVRDAFEFFEHDNSTFDAVLLLDVLEHLETDKSVQLIRLIKNALKAGGAFIIQAPNAISPLSPNRHWDLTHQRAYTTHSMQQTLLLGGFTQENIACLEIPPHVHGLKSLARRIVWSCILKPLFSTYMLAANGDLMGGIFSNNMLAVARKR